MFFPNPVVLPGIVKNHVIKSISFVDLVILVILNKKKKRRKEEFEAFIHLYTASQRDI